MGLTASFAAQAIRRARRERFTVPSRSAHKLAVKAALSAYDTLKKGDHAGWMAIALFDAALHQVERLFAVSGRHCVHHKEREEIIKEQHKDIWKDYLELRSESMKARFLVKGSNRDKAASTHRSAFSLSAKQVEYQLKLKRYSAVADYVHSRFPESGSS
jgi:hypothetical protein